MTAEQRSQISKLYYEMYEKLRMYAKSNLANKALAEEAVQETFRIACMKPEELLTSPNPAGWLLNTLRNTIRNTKHTCANAEKLLDACRKNQCVEEYSAEEVLPLQVVYGDIAETDAFQLIWEMAVEGRSQLEMAQRRGISLDACKKRVQRAKEFLRKRI